MPALGQVEFRLSDAELKAYSALALSRTNSHLATRQFMVVTTVVAVFIFSAVSQNIEMVNRAIGLANSATLLFVEGTVLGCAMALVVQRLRLRWDFYMARESPNSEAQRHVVFSWSDDGLRFSNSLQRTFCPWTAFVGITQERGLIVLWFADNRGAAIPEHAFTAPQLRDEFCRFAKERISGSGPPIAIETATGGGTR